MKLAKLSLAVAAGLLALGAQADTLAKFKTNGKAVMGVRESSIPLSYTIGDGKYVGYHVEICERILRNARAKAGVANLAIEYVPVTSQNRQPLLMNGTVDIECGSTTNNATRQQQVAFALTTYITEVRMAVRANSGIDSINQLNGKTVITTTGTTSVQHLRRHEKSAGVDFKEVYGKDHADSFLLLETGRGEAFIMDDNLLAGLIANSKAPADFKIAGEVLNVEPIAIMLRKDDPEFKKVADDTIRDLIKSGELTKLYAKWFTSPIPPKNSNLNMPMGAGLKAALANPNDNPMEAYAKK
ncbi:amino acid ABC transporter substrate-binding protein [Parvibium lacunae]|uniref:Amino acid ABC transporter substrate-binding protein n=1 Tax=Parvibium lacunae TaxID=1888893 RepID=A0A368KYN8_9BURK|nr:amino acid ABC transporter substrate-binding protein [Parvibium lacunae]RCS56536.1 amino acid ABC transporter substrate-binding protein [Parvibium lacunae]